MQGLGKKEQHLVTIKYREKMKATELNATKRTDIYSIDPRNVVVVPNFNARRDFQLDELKEQIKAKGVLNPITVVPFKDEEGSEKYRLVDGERRLRATLAAIEEGAEIMRIKAIFLPRNTSEEQLLVEQVMRNEGKNFTEYEYAIIFHRFKEQYGYTQAEIATKFGKSGAFISRCISLMELAPEIQQSMASGEISTKAVREIVELHKGDEQAQVKAVEAAVGNAKEAGKKTATGKNISAELKAQKEVAKVRKVVQQLADMFEEAGFDTVGITLDGLRAALEGATSLEQVKSLIF